jgi:hypothetical protein
LSEIGIVDVAAAFADATRATRRSRSMDCGDKRDIPPSCQLMVR